MYHYLFILYFICAHECDKTNLNLIFEADHFYLMLPDKNNMFNLKYINKQKIRDNYNKIENVRQSYFNYLSHFILLQLS